MHIPLSDGAGEDMKDTCNGLASFEWNHIHTEEEGHRVMIRVAFESDMIPVD